MVSHLRENNETYLRHLRKAMYISVCMLAGCCTAFVHAIVPMIFTKTTSKILSHVKDVINNRRCICGKDSKA
jgi:cobalamin-dependent methionine synthase I